MEVQKISETAFLSSLWDTWRIKFSQSHSLKRLSCSVASGRPNCFTLLVLDGGSKISESAFLSSLWDTWRIKSLKRLSCSVASEGHYFLIVLDTDLNNIWKRFFSSLRNTWWIQFSQSHSLKRLSYSVASGRPKYFLLVLDGSSNNNWKRFFSSLRNTWAELFKAGLRYPGLVRDLNSDMKV